MLKASAWLTFLLASAMAQEPLQVHSQQAVLTTRLGDLVLELYPGAAPNHVRHFVQAVEDGEYDGTTFHRAVYMGIIQAGDPLSKDESNRERYGTGGLNRLAKEASPVPHSRGALSAVLIPGRPDSAGLQFFICVTDQTQLDGDFTAFGRVVEGIEVAEAISQMKTDDQQRIVERLEIERAFLRDPPAPEPIPFQDAPAVELSQHRALIRTPHGEITLEFFAQDAPEHVRQFLRFAQLGLYDGTTFHRVSPGFVIQGGNISARQPPAPEKQRELLRGLPLELNANLHEKGTLSMARGDDPNSGIDSFFIALDRLQHLDGVYTVFGKVVEGLDVVDRIASVAVDGEAPVEPIPITIKVVVP